MRSVPLPLLDGLDLMYHPGIRLLKCTECKMFVNPRSAANHSANTHWYIVASATRKQLERDFPNPSWTKPYPLVEFGTPLPPIDDLPIVRGWMCVVDECGFIHDSRKSMDTHVVKQHHREPENDCVREVNATKLVLGNPPIWIAVDGELTDPPPVVKHGPLGPHLSPFEQEDKGRWNRVEDTEDVSTSTTTAVEGSEPEQQQRCPRRAMSERSQTASSSKSEVKQQARPEPAGTYPTLEQFFQPLRSHPTLDATDSAMLLHPGLNLIKCGICHTFLLPSQVPGHFRSSHHAHTRTQTWLGIPRTFPDPQWIRPFPELAVGDGFPRIEGLPVVPAVQCAYDDCGVVCSSKDTLKGHFTTAHPDEPYAGQFLECKASKFMVTPERENVYIPIAGEADDPGDSARAAATPATIPKNAAGTPSARQRQPSGRKAAAVASQHLRLPSPPPPLPNLNRSAPSASRKRKREESRTYPRSCRVGPC